MKIFAYFNSFFPPLEKVEPNQPLRKVEPNLPLEKVLWSKSTLFTPLEIKILSLYMIILLGFPKSGTLSFQKLFVNLGYISYHWQKENMYIGTMIYKNKKNNKPLLNDFLETDVITQMDICVDENNAYWPQITDYEKLYNENVDSIFILNKRDPKKLLSSFKRWNNLHKRLIKYNPELLNNNTDECFIDFVIKHYTDVESFFSNCPNSKFITFDIENDKLEKLNKYINLKDIKEFPHENQNKSAF